MKIFTSLICSSAVIWLCASGCSGSSSGSGDNGGSGGHSPGGASGGLSGGAGGLEPQGGSAGATSPAGVAGDAAGGVGGSGAAGESAGGDDAGAGGSARRSSTMSDGLVSWWRGDGDARDSAGTNHGVLQGGVTFVPGKIGQAFEFDGTDAVSVPASTTLNLTQGYTIAYWIRASAWPSSEVLVVNKWVAAAEDKLIAVEPSGKISLYLANVMNQMRLGSATALTVNTWHHVTATYDGTKARIYVDGALDASVAAAGNILNSTGALSFAHNAVRGAQETGFNTFFAGDLDDVRWYSRPLSDAEVALLVADGN
jgi:hypothetical protein